VNTSLGLLDADKLKSILEIQNVYVPVIVEQSPRGERSYDLWSRLMKDRIIFIGDQIYDQMANVIVAQFLFLEKEDPDKDIEVYINSPGGSVVAGLATMGAVLLSGGTKGKRSSLPNSRIMIHQGSAGFEGTPSDIEIQAREVLRFKQKLTEILSENCGRSYEEVAKDIDRDYWMSPDEGIQYGIIDEVLRNR